MIRALGQSLVTIFGQDLAVDPSITGMREEVELARAGMAVGLAGLFLESHPNPNTARCDGPSALPLEHLEAFLKQVKAIDDIVKAMPALQIS